MTSRRVLCATLYVGLFVGWAIPALAQGAQCSTSENIVRIQTRGPIGGASGMGSGLTAPLQVIGYNSAGKHFDITRCVTWQEPTPDVVTRIAGGPTGSQLQTGALANQQPGDLVSGRLEAVFKNNEGKVLRAHKLVTVNFGSIKPPLTQFLVKAPTLPVAAPPPIQPATAGASAAGAGADNTLLWGLGLAGAAGAAAIAFSGMDFGGGGSSSSCPANPCASTILASCSCFPCSFFFVSCSGGGPGSDCKQCGI